MQKQNKTKTKLKKKTLLNCIKHIHGIKREVKLEFN